MSVRVNGLMLGKFMSTFNPALHLRLLADARNGARKVLVPINTVEDINSSEGCIVSGFLFLIPKKKFYISFQIYLLYIFYKEGNPCSMRGSRNYEIKKKTIKFMMI